MSRTVRVDRFVPVPPAQVFAVLADGWSYPLWVVGATHMRAVDDGWPAVGTRLHHSVGSWPLQLQDKTEVLEMKPDELLELKVHAWPTGAGQVRLTLTPEGDGTRVEMVENAVSGPAVLLPGLVQGPLLWARNQESLARLASIAVHRQAGT